MKVLAISGATLVAAACTAGWPSPPPTTTPTTSNVALDDVTAEVGIALPRGAEVTSTHNIADEPTTYRIIFTAPHESVRAWCADEIGSDLPATGLTEQDQELLGVDSAPEGARICSALSSNHTWQQTALVTTDTPAKVRLAVYRAS
ncbi:hypothetical protein NMQ01_14665 [Janibacter sp. CX7]|uniref:hypothetical protein n=1 Tax=Janibacter sp. CX7 TaxID=2963431 RepID=UPI0020CDF3C0|nr:hypothetical protein [Janibacter sp. CX7]UTT65920.1 hypothetical protein NMQ01_14665 [Janibacter sp. CX7]